MRVVDRALRSARATVAAGPAATTLRFDMADTGFVSAQRDRHPSQGYPRLAEQESSGRPGAPSITGQWVAWAMASLGALVLGLGLGLISWAILGERFDLWRPGLGATVVGQGLLIVGLLQILANLWRAGRQATWRLSQMHDELRRLRRTSEQAAGRHAATAAHFYADLARDAGPDVMMGNLQGQIDRLAARLRAE